MRLARDVMPGGVDERGPVPVTAIQVSPQHDYANIADQIAGGAMSGTAQDVEERSSGAADLVMTYYTEAELIAYYKLAERFAVCDHWFAAHPGGTWPNRWATLTGTTPMLVNPELDDPGLAYVEGETIFSWLSAYGIEWRLFESDLSLVRTFNRHRIDSQRVVPLHLRPPGGLGIGEGTTFWDLAARGALPPWCSSNRTSAISPHSRAERRSRSSRPETGPMPRRSNRGLARRVTSVERRHVRHHLRRARRLLRPRPPAGNPPGPPEWQGRIPRIHPDGPDHLGVRVPAMVVSL